MTSQRGFVGRTDIQLHTPPGAAPIMLGRCVSGNAQPQTLERDQGATSASVRCAPADFESAEHVPQQAASAPSAVPSAAPTVGTASLLQGPEGTHVLIIRRDAVNRASPPAKRNSKKPEKSGWGNNFVRMDLKVRMWAGRGPLISSPAEYITTHHGSTDSAHHTSQPTEREGQQQVPIQQAQGVCASRAATVEE